MAGFSDDFFNTPSGLRVVVEDEPNPPRDYAFRQTFRIGRAPECDICINNTYVSRAHVEAAFSDGVWQLRDLNSSNGMFVAGERVSSLRIPPDATIRLGVGGPFVSFAAEHDVRSPIQPVPSVLPDREPAAALLSPPHVVRVSPLGALLKPESPPPVAASAPAMPPEPTVASYVNRYFGKRTDGPVGQHTLMVRMAFSTVQKKQKSRWLAIVGALALAILVVSGFAVYEHQRAERQRTLAEGLFYSMKSLDVDIANFERVVMDTNHEGVMAQLRKYQQRRRDMEERYNRFMAASNIDNSRLTPQQRITLRVARIFGECELTMPPNFQAEINKYIQRWKSSGRLSRALSRARESNYLRTISNELLAVNLPPQFLYLALQESDFDPYTSGPKTRKGIAKGMWQFIPETAVKYGLRIGPLVDLPRPDPSDDRHHWELETKAAARYMKDLYGTDAQASGLLVMACYNWGEDRVLPLVRSMPASPDERNFWKLLAKYRDRIPQETYDYVFSIVSAAIIGEDPRLFGFDFDNPLASVR